LLEAFLTAEARGFFAVARLVGLAFAPPVFEADRPEADLGDFFRVFLDIRLPFVAFSGVFWDSWGLRSGARTAFCGWAILTSLRYGDSQSIEFTTLSGQRSNDERYNKLRLDL
jgi:hypothetical protein